MNGISHKQAIQWIDRRLDGLLHESQLSALNEHLKSCDSCRAYAADMDGLSAHLQNEFRRRWDSQPGPSQKVFDDVVTKARNIPMAKRISSGVKLFAGATALIVLAFAINFVVSRVQSTTSLANATETTEALAAARLLAFASDQNGNFDIYTVRADGSGLTNLTNHPANDSYPIWSPDGKRIAFESDRDGFRQIYLINADGSNLARLTNEAADHGLSLTRDGKYNPWSPDGSKLVFVQEDPGGETAAIYSVDVNRQNKVKLFDGKNLFGDISWSPDGNHIAFVLNDSPTPRETYVPDIYIVGSDGNQLRELQSFLPQGETLAFTPYYWSSNGQSIVFTSYTVTNSPLRQTSYEFDVITNTLSNRTELRPDVVEWRDGIALRIDVNQDAMPYVWERADGTTHTFEESGTWGESCSVDLTRSPQNNFAIGGYCPTTKFNLYWTNADGSTIKHLLHLPIHLSMGGVGDIAWSPDDQYIAFNLTTDEKTEMYVLNVEDALANPSVEPIRFPVSAEKRYRIPSWQPVANNVIVEQEPTLEPTAVVEPARSLPIDTGVENGEWIAFIGSTMVSEPIGSAGMTDFKDVYLIHPDGSGLVNLTNSPDDYFWLSWSPDGKNLLVLRNTETVDILRRTEPNGFDVLVSTGIDAVLKIGTSEKPISYSWSPNSEQIAFLDHRAGNYDIYTIYADGRSDPQLKQLTNDPDPEFGFVWSPDGTQIAYQKTNEDQLALMVMNADGSNQHEVARGAGELKLRWSLDGTSIYASSTLGPPYGMLACEGCATEPAIYQINLEEPSVHQIYFEEDAEYGWVFYDTPQNELYFTQMHFDELGMGMWGIWKYWDGNSIHEIGAMDPRQACETTTGNIVNEHIAPNERFSIITNFCAGGFDLYLADREAATPEQRLTHILRLPSDTLGVGANEAYLPMIWSPDGQLLIYSDDRGTYFLDLERALQDPGTALTRFMEPVYYTGGDGLQYQSSETINVWSLVWQPKP